MTDNHRQKYITSTILIPYGVVQNTPEPFITEQEVVVTIEPTDKNKLRVKFDFTNTNLSQTDALKFAQEKTDDIAHSISLQHKLNTQVVSTHAVVWGNRVGSERRAEISGRAAIVLPIHIASEFSTGLNKHGMSLGFFSEALRYKEMSGKEKEVGFWLYFSLEALQTELYNKKDINSLAADIIKTGITNSARFNAYKNSVGRYYRHFEVAYPGEALSIEECVNLHQKVLNHFVTSAD